MPVDLSRVPEGKQRQIVEMAGSFVRSAEICKALDLSISHVDNTRSLFKDEIKALQDETSTFISESIAERKQRIANKIVLKDEEAVDNADMSEIKFSDLAPLRRTYLGDKTQSEVIIKLDPDTARAIAATRALVRPTQRSLPPTTIERVDE